MADGAVSTPGLTFPRDAFAKATPAPFLLAHLKQAAAVRPNGRAPNEFRSSIINTGSLTHSNGSAVVRCGDTAVVCGVRGEILLASDVPHPPGEDVDERDLIENLGLIVPNLELSTGCSPAHLPGNAPGSLAQSLSYRINSLLHDSHMINLADLRINYIEPKSEDDLADQEPRLVTKAYWALYVDILCLALDGNAFDTAWLAVTAALQDTKLPGAWWDADRESILCSPLTSDAHALRLREIPMASTFAVFTTASSLKPRDFAQSWVLADPDSFEEDVCDETLTVVLISTENAGKAILKVEKRGGPFVDKKVMRHCVQEAEAQCEKIWAASTNG